MGYMRLKRYKESKQGVKAEQGVQVNWKSRLLTVAVFGVLIGVIVWNLPEMIDGWLYKQYITPNE